MNIHSQGDLKSEISWLKNGDGQNLISLEDRMLFTYVGELINPYQFNTKHH